MKQIKIAKRDEKKVNIVLGCLLLTFLASLPLFTDFLLYGADLQFQLLRIEALRDGLKEAGILLWSKPDWIEPKGFSFAFFYGDTFLYIPAFFRMAGINVQMSYRIFLVMINAATAFGSFAAFRKIFQDDYTGLLGSALYTMSVYRVFLLYSEAELGEVLALIFLPFVLAGACLIFYEGQKERRFGWIWLSLGLSGMLRSHIFSFGTAAMFLVIFAAVQFKRLKEAAVWKQIGLSAAAVLLLNCNYLYAVLQYVRTGGFVINPVSGVPIQDKGVQIIQLFMGFYQAGGNREFGAGGVGDAAPVGLGIVFLLAISVFCYFLFVYGEDFKKEEKGKGAVALGIGLFACLLGTLCFPWDSVLKWSGFTSSLVSMIQAPWHFLQTALLAFTVLGCITYRMAGKKFGELYGKIYGLGLAGAGIFSSSYLVANLLFYSDFIRVRAGEEIWVPIAEEGGEGLPVLASGVQHFAADGLWYVFAAVSILTLGLCIFYIIKKKKQ